MICVVIPQVISGARKSLNCITSGDWSLGRERWRLLGDREKSSCDDPSSGNTNPFFNISCSRSRGVRGVYNPNSAPLDLPLFSQLAEMGRGAKGLR